MTSKTLDRKQLRRGFTLTELTIVIVIGALLSIMVIGRSRHANPDSSDARTSAALINAARIGLIKKTTQASTLWNANKSTPDALVAMLKAQGCFNNSDTITVPDNYTCTIGTVSDQVKIEHN